MKIQNSILVYIILLFTIISCEEVLLEENLGDIIMESISPSQNAVIVSNAVQFSWEHQRIYDTIQYHLQIATPSFEAPQLIIDTIVNHRQHTQSLNDGNYAWRVRAENNATFSAYSSIVNFTVQTTDLSQATVVLSSPSGSFITNSSPIEFHWENISGANLYRFELLNGSGSFYQTTTSQNQISVQFFDDEDGSYTWRVRAEDDFVHSSYSERSFLLDRGSPNRPLLSSPENNESQSTGEKIFEWQRTPISRSIEFDSLYIAANSNFTQGLQKFKSETRTKNVVLNNTGTYFWKVKSFDEAGNESLDSEVFQLNLQ